MTPYAYGRTSRPANRRFTGSDPRTDRARVVEAMLREGLKPSEIADALGVSRSTLSGFMARYGIRKP